MDWKRKWKEELDEIVPQMSDRVRYADICATSEEIKTETKGKKAIMPALVSSLTAVIVALVLCFSSIFAPQPTPGYETLVLSINPSVAITADESGNATHLTSLNRDADVLITAVSDESWKGKPIAEVARLLADEAVRLGYIDADAQSKISLSGTNESVLNTVRASVQGYFMQKGVYCAVVSDRVDEGTLSSNAGIDLKNPNNLGKLVIQRESLDISAGGFDERFESMINEQDISEVIKAGIASQIELARKKAQAVQEISTLNACIIEHESNVFGFDYWLIDEFAAIVQSQELDALIAQMAQLLDEADRDYGLKITDSVSLAFMEVIYDEDALEQNVAALNEIATVLEYVNGEIKSIVATALSKIGGQLEYLTKMPQTAEQYVSASLEFFDTKIEAMAKDCEQKYNEQRPSISAEDYQKFLNEFLAN